MANGRGPKEMVGVCNLFLFWFVQYADALRPPPGSLDMLFWPQYIQSHTYSVLFW